MPTLFDRLSQLWRRLLFYLQRDRFDRELEEEMRFHLEMTAKENLAVGISPEEARYKAQRQFVNQTFLREVSRDMSRLNRPPGLMYLVIYFTEVLHNFY
jgi:hypothetical protein